MVVVAVAVVLAGTTEAAALEVVVVIVVVLVVVVAEAAAAAVVVPILVSARSKAWVCGHSLAGGLRVRFPPWPWMSVCCECCVLSANGRSLFQRSLIECGVFECGHEALVVRRLSD